MLGSISRMKSLIAPPLSSISMAPHFSSFFPLPSESIISPLPTFRRYPVATPLKTPVMLSLFPFQNRGLQSKAFPSSSSGEIHVIIGPMFAGKTTTLPRHMQSESEDGSFQVSSLLQLNKMLKGLCFSGRIREAVSMLWCMTSKVDHGTYALLLQESIFRKQYKLGRRIHAQMVVVGYVPGEYLKTKLLILHEKSGDLKSAHVLFDMLIDKSLISWNAMIAGYVQNELEEVGIGLYYKMRQNGLTPDQYTFASLFRACAALAMVEHGKKAHATLIKCHLRENVVVSSALIDMYFKCSYLSDGHKVFDSALERNVITWTSFISGYGQHGRVTEVLESFSRMKDEGFRPNYVTFLAVLSACSHGGLINEGWDYFRSMQRDFGIRPRGQHYAAMVDMLGRAGRLQEAYEFVLCAPCKDHSVIWGALLGACRIHGNMDLVKIVAKKYLELDSENAGKYVVLSNTYASFGCWDNVANVRSMMKDSGIMKEAAYSRIDVQGEVHHFLTGDNTHEKFEEICQTINRIMWILREADYVIDLEEH